MQIVYCVFFYISIAFFSIFRQKVKQVSDRLWDDATRVSHRDRPEMGGLLFLQKCKVK